MSGVKKTRALQVVAECWGANPPDYIVALAEACEAAGSQSLVARRIGYSPAVISTTLKNYYKGDSGAVEIAVRAALLSETVTCPAVGQTIALATCLEHQAHVAAANRSSAFRISMIRQCPQCPNSRRGGRDA